MTFIKRTYLSRAEPDTKRVDTKEKSRKGKASHNIIISPSLHTRRDIVWGV
jgi:hypothetical protein